METQQTAEETGARPSRKTRVGVVTSNKMQKTVVVTVRRRTTHRDYGKIQTTRVKYKAHAEGHDYPKSITLREGDKVLIAETRPLSRDKRWRVVKVLSTTTQV